jgi:DNA polymerase-3 subunit gamma/tau
LLSENGKALAAQQLHDYVGLVRYAPGTLALRPTKPLPADFLKELSNALKGLTGMNWTVTLADEVAAPSLREQELLQEGAARDAILATPMVVAAMQAFPDAILIEDEANTAG